MVIELLADAGIRPRAHGRTDILVSATEVRAQVAAAAARGEPIHITGDVESPLGRAAIEQLTHPGVDVTIAPAAPNAWPRRWTSLQVAANEGRDDVVRDLLARGASIPTPLRPDHTPYRLAMRHGYFDVMRTLRDAGAPLPVGLQPPALLPNAVVARNYLPAFFWWLTLAVCALGIVAAIMIHPALLVVPIAVLPQPSFANVAIGRNRVAVDGPLISVSEFLGRQGLGRPAPARGARAYRELAESVDMDVDPAPGRRITSPIYQHGLWFRAGGAATAGTKPAQGDNPVRDGLAVARIGTSSGRVRARFHRPASARPAGRHLSKPAFTQPMARIRLCMPVKSLTGRIDKQ